MQPAQRVLANGSRRPPSASSRRVGGIAARRCALVFALFTGLTGAISAIGAPSGASSVSVLRGEAAAIGEKVDVIDTKLQILSEEYDQAATREADLRAQIGADKSALSRSRATVALDTVELDRQAVAAYVGAGSTNGLSVALSADPDALPLTQTYLAAASGSLQGAVSSLQYSEHSLEVETAALDTAEHTAALTTQTLGSALDQAQSLDDQLQTTLAGVQGSLAQAVSRQEAAQEAAAQRAAAAQAAAAQAAQAQPGPSLASSPVASGGSGAGAAAVKAAESQIGVPYVWAGSTPGEGFDCSGLAMWAWGQAGVSLPHSAEAQYESIEHVSMSDLEPGDLIFYADGGYVYHVVMYVGNGEVVQALETGTDIAVGPVPPGAYAAGRP